MSMPAPSSPSANGTESRSAVQADLIQKDRQSVEAARSAETRPAAPRLGRTIGGVFFVPLSQIAEQRLTLRDLLPVLPAALISLVLNAFFVGTIWFNMQTEAAAAQNARAKKMAKEELEALEDPAAKKKKEEKEDFILAEGMKDLSGNLVIDPSTPINPIDLPDIERKDENPGNLIGLERPPAELKDPIDGIGPNKDAGGIAGVNGDGDPGIRGSDFFDKAMGSPFHKDGGNLIGDGAGLPWGEGGGSRDAGGYGYRKNATDIARREGGNDASQQAVGLALEWLAKHQWQDGRWTMNKYPPESPLGKAKDTAGLGSSDNDVAATSLALLCFLGANHTHTNDKSPYRDVVRAGLRFLQAHQDNNGSIRLTTAKDQQSWIYGHALATMALCEAYALSGDTRLQPWAQRAVQFLEHAQNKTTGGWRYKPWKPADKDKEFETSGDTSVTGWVLMALRSAQLAKLRIDPKTWDLAEKWLNSCGSEGNSKYSYEPKGGPSLTMTAAGLLGRQYLGWGPLNPDLHKGCEYMLKEGLPQFRNADSKNKSLGNIYFCYYAAQVLHNIEGKYWEQWNPVVRDWLVATQETDGPRKGSWTGADFSPHGGRVYATALACLTLEIYYRYMPLYRKPDPKDRLPSLPTNKGKEPEK